MQRDSFASEVLRRAAWPPLVVFLVHVAASLAGGYEREPRLDVAMHLLGGIAIACFFAGVLDALGRRRAELRLDARLFAALILSSTGCAAVLWEFAEYLSDRFAGTAAQRGLEDTLADMLLGLVGGAVFVAWRAARRRARSPT